MKLVFISDTHGDHKDLKNIPETDVLIHCGDISALGSQSSIEYFLEWFSSLEQAKNKIFVAGNHDFLFQRNPLLARSLVPSNVIYLEDSGCEIDGVKFWGTPVQLPFYNWAFNTPADKIIDYWNMIPCDTDVLITHSPPYGIMDVSHWGRNHIGSQSLYDQISTRIKPKIHCFGHLHEGYGVQNIGDTIFINASNLDDNYAVANPPILIEI